MMALSCPAADILVPIAGKISASRPTKTAYKRTIATKKKIVYRKSELFDINDFDDVIIDDDIVLGRNRRVRDYGKVTHESEEDLSDYVKIRLALAKMKALKRYREIVA